MRDVIGPRNWVFWWAAITASIFLKDWLPTLSDFFRDTTFFSSNSLPWSLLSGLNGWLDSIAQGIEDSVQFDPNQAIIVSPITVPNSILALLIGFLILGGAIGLYVRALHSNAIGDDIVTLLVLYFVLRIEAYIIGLTQFSPLQGAGEAVLQDTTLTFWILMFMLLVLILLGGGVRSRRAFWRGLFEAIIIALFVVPEQTAGALAAFFDGLYTIVQLLQGNVIVGLLWGIIGMLLAITRLTSNASPT